MLSRERAAEYVALLKQNAKHHNVVQSRLCTLYNQFVVPDQSAGRLHARVTWKLPRQMEAVVVNTKSEVNTSSPPWLGWNPVAEQILEYTYI